jgi:hypothetical protein
VSVWALRLPKLSFWHEKATTGAAEVGQRRPSEGGLSCRGAGRNRLGALRHCAPLIYPSGRVTEAASERAFLGGQSHEGWFSVRSPRPCPPGDSTKPAPSSGSGDRSFILRLELVGSTLLPKRCLGGDSVRAVGFHWGRASESHGERTSSTALVWRPCHVGPPHQLPV